MGRLIGVPPASLHCPGHPRNEERGPGMDPGPRPDHRLRQPRPRARPSTSALAHSSLRMVIFRPFACSCFGIWTCRMPFSKRASILSGSTVRGSVKERWKLP